MPKNRVRVPLGDFTGGLNEDDAPGETATVMREPPRQGGIDFGET